jgi:hypothetical protein
MLTFIILMLSFNRCLWNNLQRLLLPLLRRRSFQWLSLNFYVTPNLLTEPIILSINKSEEWNVVSWDIWSYHLNRNINLFIRLHYLSESFIRSFKIITICLNKEGIFRPVEFTAIFESPGFDEFFTCKYGVSITEILFNESCLV